MASAEYSRTWRERNPEQYKASIAGWRERNPDRVKVAARLQNTGVSEEQYDALHLMQYGLCAVCGKPETRQTASGETMALSVDHDHSCCPGRKTCGKCIRGLLCGNCNTAIGLFGDDSSLLKRAVEYLRPSGWPV